jgi:hypothetical protein
MSTKLLQEWENKLALAKNAKEKQIAEKRIARLKSDLGLTSEITSTPIADSDHIRQVAEKVSGLITERDKITRMLTRHDGAELRAKLELLNEQIAALEVPEHSDTDETREMYSNVLGEKFVWNVTQGIIVFESGAKYSTEEIAGMPESAIKTIHNIKSQFNAIYKGTEKLYKEAV